MRIDPAALREEVAAHPWRTVALAFAAGVYLALAESGGRSARTLAGTLASTAFAVAREAMIRRVRTQAHSWIDFTHRRERATA